jgi:type I restriction enzyme, R subunit
MLAAAGWAVQDARAVNLSAAQGVAVREFVMKPPHGRADYLLFVDGAAVGVIEAKKEGETLRGVQWQSAKYVDGAPDEVPTAIDGALPFVYESTGAETHFTNTLDPDAASREVFSFHQPKTLADWLEHIREHPTAPTLRHRLDNLPERTPAGLWPAQFTAIHNLEVSLAANRPSSSRRTRPTSPPRPSSPASAPRERTLERSLGGASKRDTWIQAMFTDRS